MALGGAGQGKGPGRASVLYLDSTAAKHAGCILNSLLAGRVYRDSLVLQICGVSRASLVLIVARDAVVAQRLRQRLWLLDKLDRHPLSPLTRLFLRV